MFLHVCACNKHICAQVCIRGLTDSKHSFFIDRYAARTPLSALFNASLKSHLATIFIRLECQMCVSSQVHLSSLFLYSSARSRGRLRALRDGGFFLLDPSAPAVWLAIYKEQQAAVYLSEHHRALLVHFMLLLCNTKAYAWRDHTIGEQIASKLLETICPASSTLNYVLWGWECHRFVRVSPVNKVEQY